MKIFIVIEETKDKRGYEYLQEPHIIGCFRKNSHAECYIESLESEDNLGSGESMEEYNDMIENREIIRTIHKETLEPNTWTCDMENEEEEDEDE